MAGSFGYESAEWSRDKDGCVGCAGCCRDWLHLEASLESKLDLLEAPLSHQVLGCVTWYLMTLDIDRHLILLSYCDRRLENGKHIRRIVQI